MRLQSPLGPALTLAVGLFGAGCGVDETGISPIIESGGVTASEFEPLYYPIGLAPHPDGRYLFVANAGFDRRYNAGTVSVYDAEAGRIVPELTTKIGLFAGDMVAGRVPGSDAVQLFVATRDLGELYRIEVVEDASGTITALNAQASTDFGGRTLSAEPYGLALDPDGQGLTMTHTAQGVVSRWSTNPDYWPADASAAGPYRCSTPVSEGATAVAQHPVLGWWYTSDRFSPGIKVVAEVPESVDDDERDGACRLFQVTIMRVDARDARARSRGIAFNSDGTMLFVAGFSTDVSGGAIRIFDTTVGPSGRPFNRLIDSIGLGTRPNMVRVAGCRAEACPEGTDPASLEAKGQGLVYATAFATDRLFVIDPAARTVLARIDVGEGPHDIAFMLDGQGRMQGYVSNFDDNTLSVIDLEPGSPDRFTVVNTIE